MTTSAGIFAIRDALIPGYPGQLPGPRTRHLTALAALISGIVGSKGTQLPHIATKVPDGTQAESRVKRFARWMRNDRITEEVYFVPYAQVLLAHLALQTLVLIMDGSVVGRGCVALMMHVVYKGRALPWAWQVRKGKQGHFPEDLHIALVKQVQTLIPLGASVVVLGDGEFDGTTLQHTLQNAQWSYVVRTGRHITVRWDGERFRGETVAACIKPGTLVALTDVHVTAAAYGPVILLCCWGLATDRLRTVAAKGHHGGLVCVASRAGRWLVGPMQIKHLRNCKLQHAYSRTQRKSLSSIFTSL